MLQACCYIHQELFNTMLYCFLQLKNKMHPECKGPLKAISESFFTYLQRTSRLTWKMTIFKQLHVSMHAMPRHNSKWLDGKPIKICILAVYWISANKIRNDKNLCLVQNTTTLMFTTKKLGVNQKKTRSYNKVHVHHTLSNRMSTVQQTAIGCTGCQIRNLQVTS